MTTEFNPTHGLMEMTDACSKMQTALLNAETSTAALIMTESLLLQQTYNEQTEGDKEIPAPHSANNMFSITYARTMYKTQNGWTIDTITYEFNDPGYPPPSVTGTDAENYKAETEATRHPLRGGLSPQGMP